MEQKKTHKAKADYTLISPPPLDLTSPIARRQLAKQFGFGWRYSEPYPPEPPPVPAAPEPKRKLPVQTGPPAALLCQTCGAITTFVLQGTQSASWWWQNDKWFHACGGYTKPLAPAVVLDDIVPEAPVDVHYEYKEVKNS